MYFRSRSFFTINKKNSKICLIWSEESKKRHFCSSIFFSTIDRKSAPIRRHIDRISSIYRPNIDGKSMHNRCKSRNFFTGLDRMQYYTKIIFPNFQTILFIRFQEKRVLRMVSVITDIRISNTFFLEKNEYNFLKIWEIMSCIILHPV